MASKDDIAAVKRNYYVTALGLSPMTNLSLNDLEYMFYSNPPAGGGGGGTTYTAGNGIDITGTVLSVKTDPAGMMTNTASGVGVDPSKVSRGKAIAVPAGASPVINHGLNTQRVHVMLRTISTNDIVLVDPVATDANNITLNFATPATGGQYEAIVTAIG